MGGGGGGGMVGFRLCQPGENSWREFVTLVVGGPRAVAAVAVVVAAVAVAMLVPLVSRKKRRGGDS